MPRAQQTSSSSVDDRDAFSFDTTGFVYERDPVGFVLDCIDWSRFASHDRPTPYQLDGLSGVVDDGRYAMRGPHGLGKTAFAAWLILWFAITREALGRQWKAPTTAGSWLQLKKFLWPEVHKWARLLRWEIVGRVPFGDGTELLDLSQNRNCGEAFAVASNQPSRVEGAHADSVLFLFDESKAIADEMFDAAEGAFAGAGPDTRREAFAVAISTPGPSRGRFYDIHARKRGFEDWRVRHVTATEAIEAGRMSQAWLDSRKRQWGAESALYLNRALGEFANDEVDSVIPLSWVEAANERWLAYVDEHGRPSFDPKSPDAAYRPAKGRVPRQLTALSVDVSYGGADASRVALREQRIIWDIPTIEVEQKRNPNAKIAGWVTLLHRLFGGVAIVDVIGWGAGCVEMLRLMTPPVPVIAFSASVRAETSDGKPIKDRTGEIDFADLRSAGWWHLRELLDPENADAIMLPPDDALLHRSDDGSLTGDLVEPKWDYVAGGRIRVESKEDIRARLGRSTDDGDAVMQAFVVEFLRSVRPTGMPLPIGSSASKWRQE